MKRANIVALVAVAGIVLALFFLGTGGAQRIQSMALGIISPFLRSGSGLEKKVTAIRQGLKSLAELEREAEQLRVRNKELEAVNTTLRDLESENNRLRRALQYREREIFRLIPAQIIARDASTWWNTVKIDRGSDDGIASEMPVLTETGLVGKVTTVSASSAIVVLISDENCKVAARVEGTREQGIVSGQRDSGAGMPQVGMWVRSKLAKLEPGQKVYSSGVGGVYPSGLLIGTIRDFKVRELDAYATLNPAVELTTLEDVFVVTGKK